MSFSSHESENENTERNIKLRALKFPGTQKFSTQTPLRTCRPKMKAQRESIAERTRLELTLNSGLLPQRFSFSSQFLWCLYQVFLDAVTYHLPSLVIVTYIAVQLHLFRVKLHSAQNPETLTESDEMRPRSFVGTKSVPSEVLRLSSRRTRREI